MVGFISLCGIATRNGILLLDHYLHLVKYEGETWSREMIIRAGQERLAPVLMTALTAGIGLVPLAMAAGQPGKEILYPVATVIIGGLISSTLLEFLVRPALFWTIGRKAGQRIVDAHYGEIELQETAVERRHALLCRHTTSMPVTVLSVVNCSISNTVHTVAAVIAMTESQTNAVIPHDDHTVTDPVDDGISSVRRTSLVRYAWLSVAAAIATIALKSGAYWLTGSVGLLSDAAESLVNLVARPLRWPCW